MSKLKSLIWNIRIHPLLWGIVAISIATAHFLELCLLIGIIFIHEMGHALAASFFSWRIKQITLLPFGGVAEFDEHGNRPLKEETLVVLAGPLQHVWMIAIAVILTKLAWLPEDLYQLFIHYNLMILIFNLLPIWPLDGGKLLFLLFSLQKPFPHAHRLTLVISAFALGFFAVLILLSAPYHVNVWVVIAFLYFSIYYEWKQRRFVFMRFLMERYYGKKDGPHLLVPLKVDGEELLIQVLERFQRGCKHPIIIDSVDNEERMLDENELLHAYFTERRVTDKIRDLLFSY